MLKEWHYLKGMGGVTLLEQVWPWWGRCGLVGRSVPLEVSFEFSKAHARHSISFFLLPADPDIATLPALCLPSGHHTLNHDSNGLNL